MSILSLNGVSLTLAGNCILDQVDWQIQPQERIALVGRNGAGKSTLLKLLQGEIVQDRGQIHQQNGLRIAGLAQEVPINHDESVYHFLVKGLGEVGEVLAQFRVESSGGDLDKMARCQHRIDDLHEYMLSEAQSVNDNLYLRFEIYDVQIGSNTQYNRELLGE